MRVTFLMKGILVSTTYQNINVSLSRPSWPWSSIWSLQDHQKSQWGELLRFSSWVVLFFSSLLFMPHLLSRGPFLMLTITIFLSWDPSYSPYAPANPYTVPSIIAGQGILFAYRFLFMDNYSSSQFSCISCVLLLFILFSMMFHDVLFLLSGTFYLIPPCSFTYSADLFWSI